MTKYFVEYRPFVQNRYFVLIVFQRCKKYIIFFGKQYIIKDYSPQKIKNEQKQKFITKPIKKNFKKVCVSITSKDVKTKKRNYANTKNKIMSDRDRQRKKGYMKNSYCKRKKMINHLINRVEEIETACFSK